MLIKYSKRLTQKVGGRGPEPAGGRRNVSEMERRRLQHRPLRRRLRPRRQNTVDGEQRTAAAAASASAPGGRRRRRRRLVHRLETLAEQHVAEEVVRPRRRRRLHHHPVVVLVAELVRVIGSSGAAPLQLTLAFYVSQRSLLYLAHTLLTRLATSADQPIYGRLMSAVDSRQSAAGERSPATPTHRTIGRPTLAFQSDGGSSSPMFREGATGD